MYYMLNQERQIVAADYELLEILEIDNLPILFSKVVNNDIKITRISDRKLTIISDISTIQSAYEEYTIKTTFGDIILVKLYNTVSKSIINSNNQDTIKDVNKLNDLLDDKTTEVNEITPNILFDDEIIEKPIKKSHKPIEDTKNQLEQDLEEASKELQAPEIKKEILEEKEAELEIEDDNNEPLLEFDDEIISEQEELLVKEEKSEELLLDFEELEPQEDEVIKEKNLVIDEEESEELLLDIDEPAPKKEVAVEEEVEEVEDLLLDDEPAPKKEIVVEEIEEVEDLLLDINEPAPKKEVAVEEEEIEEVEDLLLDIDEPAPKKEVVVEEEEVEEIEDLLLDIDEPAPKKEAVVEEEEIEEIDDLLLELDDPAPKKEVAVEEEEVEEIDDLLLDTPKPKPSPTKETITEDVEEIKDLLSDIDEEKLSPKEEKKEAPKPKIEKKPIKDYNCDDTIEINIDDRSEDMGISASDYQDFLNEFIDKSIMYDEDLRSNDKSTREEALDELQTIAESLEIANLEEILVDMQERDYLEEELVDIFFECLGQITTVTNEKPQEVVEEQEVVKEEPKIEEKEEPKEENTKGFGTLELDDIKPIHFDFRLEEAADDLSLPVDLIEEFVNDFVDQAVEEKETFIKAFAEGDIDTIQKTGHKLKGASSNLRIIPLSETLEEIQHCENPARFEPLLKKYWGQFLSFKLFMENIAH